MTDITEKPDTEKPDTEKPDTEKPTFQSTINDLLLLIRDELRPACHAAISTRSPALDQLTAGLRDVSAAVFFLQQAVDHDQSGNAAAVLAKAQVLAKQNPSLDESGRYPREDE